MRRPLEEAEVQKLREAFAVIATATTGGVSHLGAVGDCRQYGSEGVALCDSWLTQAGAIEAALGWIEQRGAMCDDYWETPDGLDCSCGCRKLVAALAVDGETGTPAEGNE